MKNLLLFSIFLLLFTVSVFSQTPQPNATPPPIPEVTSETVTISTNLIQFDAVVTDKKGNQITNLKPEDFEIFENGKKQEITNFSYIFNKTETSPLETKTQSLKDSSSIPVPPMKLKLEQVRRTYALVIDDLGLSFTTVNWVKESLRKFVNEQMEDGDLVAILRVSGGVGTLQSFTSDKRQLLAAVQKIRWNGLGRIGVNSYEPIRINTLEELSENGEPVEGVDQAKESDIAAETARQVTAGIGTLGALNYIIRGMGDLPGRKSLVLFSEGFQMFDYSTKNSVPIPTQITSNLRNLADIANRSSVVINTIDPRGLTHAMYEAQDDSSASTVAINSLPSRFDPIKMRENTIKGSQDSLRFLANETGGLAYVGQNDISFGLQKVLDDQKGYYLIGYQPDSETFDAKKNNFNKITIKTTLPDLKIRYRSGFIGITDEQFDKSTQTAEQKLNAALISPFGANELNLALYSIFFTDDKNNSFIRSFIYIDANKLNFTKEANGVHKANLEIYAMTFGENGKIIDQIAHTYIVELDEEKYRTALQKGLLYDVPFPVKKSGPYQFRLALRDKKSEKIGSASQFIEIPNIKKETGILSSIIVNNYTLEEWKQLAKGENNNSFLDSTFRQYRKGTILKYDYIIYNAKEGSLQKPALQVQTRLFHNGKIILEDKPVFVNLDGQKDLNRLEISEAVALGNDLKKGDYILQIVVTNNSNKEKKRFTTQSIDFEIVD